jgi:hypothetical protein
MTVTKPYPLFIFGIARSGTNLLSRMLDAHPAIEVTLDPFMPIFKMVRNATIAHEAKAALRIGFDASAPFQDGYETRQGYGLLDTLLDSELSAPIEQTDLPDLRAAVAARAEWEAPDIAAHAERIAGTTCRDLLASALEIVADCRATTATRYIGIKEVWVLDFIPALARAFPEARFIAIERDPRAVIASLAALAERDPSQHAHPISYLRHWRKSITLARHFIDHPKLREKFHLVRYEDLASQPLETARRLADFVALPFESLMLGAKSHAGSAGAWRANSSYSDTAPGISNTPVARWRDSLSATVISAVEYFCWPEMALTAYSCLNDVPSTGSDEVGSYVASANAHPGSWRSDCGDAATEMRFEALRHDLIDHPQAVADCDLIRRCFLFERTYRAAAAAVHGSRARRTRALL